MGNLWDAFIEGYNRPGGVSSQTPAAPAMSGEADQTPWDKLISGSRPQSPESGQSQAQGRQTVNYDYVVEGLVNRGLPQHVAEGFAMNSQDESGLNPGINEIAPLVPGSRGGFGLFQWTGPRRRQYEKFAADRGTNVADPEAQMDFLMWELENTEKAAARSILGSTSAGEAGAAIVNKFLRPAEEHRARRASKYLGGPARPVERPLNNKLWLEF